MAGVLWQEYSAALRFPSVSIPDSAAHYSSHSPASQWENVIYPPEETGQHTPLWSMQESEFPSSDFACKEHSARISTEAFKCFQMLPCFEKQRYSDT